MNRQERRFVNGQYVTWEPCDEDILRQAKAIRTARFEGMVSPSRGKTVARRKASTLRKVQTVFSGGVAVRVAKEKLGPMA